MTPAGRFAISGLGGPSGGAASTSGWTSVRANAAMRSGAESASKSRAEVARSTGCPAR